MKNIALLAQAGAGAIWTSLANAKIDSSREEYWRSHADKLEHKFTTEYGRHYSYFLPKKQKFVFRYSYELSKWIIGNIS